MQAELNMHSTASWVWEREIHEHIRQDKCMMKSWGKNKFEKSGMKMLATDYL
jgi:hypothetical protein